jgi:hypothetical protein
MLNNAAAKHAQISTYKPSKLPRRKVTNATEAELTILTGGKGSDNNASVDATIMACIRPFMIKAARNCTPAYPG